MRRILLALAAALASGLMLVLALPLGEQAYLAWFTLVPVLFAVRGQGFLVGFVCGLISVFVAAWLSVTGICYLHFRDSTGNPAWVYTGFGIFGFSLSVALGAWADRATLRLPPWWFAALATILEACLLFELPAHLALTQYRQPLMLQVAAVGGIWLVSFLIWWSNYWLATLKPARAIVAAACLIVLSFAARALHFSEHSGMQRFAAIQVAEPDEQSLAQLQAQASKLNPSLVVWPEFAGMPLAFQGDSAPLRKLSIGSAPFVTSFEDDYKPLRHNVAAVFSDGKESPRYAKRKLFGGEVRMHTPGNSALAVRYPGGVVGLNVCYDSCYPEIIRDTARLPNVNLIALPSIDPAATNNFMSAIHASYTPFRAAEEGISIIKCDGTAFSEMVDPFGNITAEAPPGNRILNATLPTTPHPTPYKLLGDWSLCLFGLLVLFGILRERQHISQSSAESATKEERCSSNGSGPTLNATSRT